MDWIEEKAEKLKEYLKNISLVRSLICYLCITSIGAVALWLFTRNICDVWMQVIGMRIQNIHYYDLDMGGKLFVSQSKKYGMILKILSVIYNNSFVIYMFIAYVIAGKVFWTKSFIRHWRRYRICSVP